MMAKSKLLQWKVNKITMKGLLIKKLIKYENASFIKIQDKIFTKFITKQIYVCAFLYWFEYIFYIMK